MCNAATARPADVLHVAQSLLRGPVAEGDAAALTDEARVLRRACDLLELRFSRVAHAAARTDEFTEPAGDGPLYWLRHECRMTGYAAVSALTVGEECRSLPESVDALERGEIGFGHLALIARTSAAVRDSLKESGAAVEAGRTVVDEDRMLAAARKHTVNRFRRDCCHVRHAIDPRGALREHAELHAARFLEIAPRDDGCVQLTGFLDPEGGAVLRTALSPLAQRGGCGDLRSQEQRNADALVEFITRSLDGGILPPTGGVRPHLTVTASADTLRGAMGSPASELEFGATIPAATVQRLACDAGIRRVVFGPESVITDVGRAVRVPAPPTRRALHARDGGCVWPGCGRPASLTSAHHVVHWAHGGSSDLENLVLLCRRHHWMVHEGGWHIARTESGAVTAVRPQDGGPRRSRQPA